MKNESICPLLLLFFFTCWADPDQTFSYCADAYNAQFFIKLSVMRGATILHIFIQETRTDIGKIPIYNILPTYIDRLSEERQKSLKIPLADYEKLLTSSAPAVKSRHELPYLVVVQQVDCEILLKRSTIQSDLAKKTKFPVVQHVRMIILFKKKV